MTSSHIRQSFLDFFRSKQHTIVPSSSLLPDSPNLLFTNAGMNQFVPIFLGQQKCPFNPPRAADTQKCIRAGGKHNDLEDVGLDTYHHTFFEMLGNWSFGDYFKKEAIEWAWELITEVWKFPKHRLYATVYKPDKSQGDPSDFDQEAYDYWAAKFSAAGLDPRVHIVNGNKKDNFWMMGETGPCGPCSEIHVDLTPQGDTKGSLVNKGDARCIEIWNLVFIQFNANQDGTFSALPARHVDTGMGFERVTGIIQNTKQFTDFSRPISNYETDIFRPLFDHLQKLSGKRYGSTLPKPGSTGSTEQEKVDVAFRVIADHIRTLSFAIADGIEPGNKERNNVLRRILRRAVRYGRILGFHEPFLSKLVDVLVASVGDVFPELRVRSEQIISVIHREEEGFNRTLDEGLKIFSMVVDAGVKYRKAFPRIRLQLDRIVDQINNAPDSAQLLGQAVSIQRKNISAILKEWLDLAGQWREIFAEARSVAPAYWDVTEGPMMKEFNRVGAINDLARTLSDERIDDEEFWDKFGEFQNAIKGLDDAAAKRSAEADLLSGDIAFVLYDTYGFPPDLTELLARERGLTVDSKRLKERLEEQRALARGAQKKEVISLANIETATPSRFVGYDRLETGSKVTDVVHHKDKTAVILDVSPCYPEMGGQVGDTGELVSGGAVWYIVGTQKAGSSFLHLVSGDDAPQIGAAVKVRVEADRRNAIQRHHTVTHLLHWAIHEVVSKEAAQKGSYVGPEKLTFDFNCAPLTRQQVLDVEKLVNERIVENAGVSWVELPYSEVKGRKDVMQFFGDKYGDRVRVVQIGGRAGELNGYSMELCGGTHTRATGEIGLFRIVSEGAIASGVRRIEAIAGNQAYAQARKQAELIETLAAKLNSPVGELEKKIDSLLSQQKELEKLARAQQQRQAAETARGLAAKAKKVGAANAIVENLGNADGDLLQMILEALPADFKGVAVLGGASNGTAALVAKVTPDLTKQFQAGKIIQTIASIVGGKGGGRPDFARGGGKDASKLDEALAKARELIAG